MSGPLFDTNIVVDALMGVEAAGAELRRYRQRWLSRLSWIEIMAGCRGDEHAVEGLLDQFTIVELSEEIARRAATLCQQRATLCMPQAVVLASAQVTGRILVTRNTDDFPAAMPGIRVPYQLGKA